MEDKVVFSNRWISVVERKIEGLDHPYTMTKQPWCNSIGVSVLPFRRITNRTGIEERREYLAVYERIIAHGEHLKLGHITGGFDKPDMTIRQIALMELREEGGIICEDEGALITLGVIKPSKSSDVINYLFAIESNHIYTPTGFSEGDGSGAEAGMFATWISKEEGILSEDPLLATMIARCELKFPYKR